MDTFEISALMAAQHRAEVLARAEHRRRLKEADAGSGRHPALRRLGRALRHGLALRRRPVPEPAPGPGSPIGASHPSRAPRPAPPAPGRSSAGSQPVPHVAGDREEAMCAESSRT
jgi:hypothetical protein